jgi:hypothetical protein
MKSPCVAILLVPVAAIILTASHYLKAADWLGQCINSTGTGTICFEVVQGQTCCGLANCSNNTASSCNAACGTCPMTAPPVTANYSQQRTIQTGNCTSSTLCGAKCNECDKTGLICDVYYHYQDVNNNGCVMRCAVPTTTNTNGPLACKP